MRKNLDRHSAGDLRAVAATERPPAERVAAPELAAQMRAQLAAFLARAAAGTLTVRVPAVPGDGVARGDGHFHLAAELFLQVAGWTDFRFPHTRLRLRPGEALVLPARLLHAVRVGGGTAAAPFCNVVVYAEGAAMSCHLAHEAEPGRPDILHLEALRHAQAPRVHDWLNDAARLGRVHSERAERDQRNQSGSANAGDDRMAAVQARALVSAAAAGVLRALDAPDPQAPPEPALVARARVLVNNQLGDPALSVRSLAAQLGCTADYLSHLFSRATGEKLAGAIVRQRMERAAHLLGQSALAGKEVAWACGFATQSYFVRSFRAHHGATPQAWRAARGLLAVVPHARLASLSPPD
jgi:AraC-like DNA-binding protein